MSAGNARNKYVLIDWSLVLQRESNHAVQHSLVFSVMKPRGVEPQPQQRKIRCYIFIAAINRHGMRRCGHHTDLRRQFAMHLVRNAPAEASRTASLRPGRNVVAFVQSADDVADPIKVTGLLDGLVPCRRYPGTFSNQSSSSTNLCRTKVSIIASRRMDRWDSQSAISKAITPSRKRRSESKHSGSVSDAFPCDPASAAGCARSSSTPASGSGGASEAGASIPASSPAGC